MSQLHSHYIVSTVTVNMSFKFHLRDIFFCYAMKVYKKLGCLKSKGYSLSQLFLLDQ